MPRGVPRNGYRKPRVSKSDKVTKIMNVAQAVEPVVVETDEEIEQKLSDRFEILADMANAAIEGDVRALIVSGPAGLGKSFTVEKALESWDPNATSHRIVKGYVKAPALFKLLYQHRTPGTVLQAPCWCSMTPTMCSSTRLLSLFSRRRLTPTTSVSFRI